jgi:signal transduction histidine kinase
LIAKVLPRLWDRDEKEGRKRLDELHQLTRGALAEMRTLLLELRPTAFAETELEQLLRHLVEAAIGRAGITITLECEGERDIGLEVKMAVYRIVQESLNNIAKHAEATEAGVNIWLAKDRLALWINDNGCGFDVAQVPPDHLGLSIMKERARSIGAELRIESEPDSGTQVTLLWQEETKGEE